jgi:hypothetical protein
MKFVPYHIRKRLKEITAPENVDVTDVSKLKSGLSGKIWEKGGILKPEVRTKMIELGKEFYKSLGIDYPIKDIFFTGSLANYNWTSHSDADVHVLFEAPEEDEFLSEYIFAKKEVWSDKHNITIYGFPVELFAKNVEDEHGSKAIYSLLQNKWVKKPSKKNVNIDSESIQIKTADLMNKIDDVEKISDDEKRFDAADKLKDKIKKMRQASLEAGGEYSTENLVFKTLRNNGYLDKLSDIKTMSFDKQKSLNEVELMNSPIKRNTLKVQKGIPGMTEEKINILKDFICFICAKLKMQDAVTVVIKKGRDESIITTASYIPGTNENHIRAGGRAIVDICRSIGHELTHNRQRELGIFNPGDQVQNIGGQIEDEANSIAGILIKDFSHNYGYDNIYEL